MTEGAGPASSGRGAGPGRSARRRRSGRARAGAGRRSVGRMQPDRRIEVQTWQSRAEDRHISIDRCFDEASRRCRSVAARLASAYRPCPVTGVIGGELGDLLCLLAGLESDGTSCLPARSSSLISQCHLRNTWLRTAMLSNSRWRTSWRLVEITEDRHRPCCPPATTPGMFTVPAATA